jgi:hypothetical protein
MRNTEKRVLAVKRRAKELKRQEQLRRSRILGVSTVASCLVFIVGCSFFLPTVMTGQRYGEYRHFGAAASIFDESGSFGYVLIGLISFVLGVGVTILCHRVHMRNQMHHEDAEVNDG